MDWNQPQPSMPVGPQNMQAPPVPAMPTQPLQQQPPFSAAPGMNPAAPSPENYASASPLQMQPPQVQPITATPPVSNVPPVQASYGSPLQPQSTQPPMPVIGNSPPGGVSSSTDDDKDVSVDDAVWIARTKRAIAESKGDPHRQALLIQHLRAEYLKQRYGRTVHTDEA